jgi:hypothetical protein
MTTYARCDGCHGRDIGLVPVRIGKPLHHHRVYLCGACAEATQAVLDEGKVVLGPVVPEELRSTLDGLVAASRVPSTRVRGTITPDSPIDEALGHEIVAGVHYCNSGHFCGLYGGSHQPHQANPWCECACHEP